MNTSFQVQESSTSVRKRIAVAIAILTVCSLLGWVTIQLALQLTSGHS